MIGSRKQLVCKLRGAQDTYVVYDVYRYRQAGGVSSCRAAGRKWVSGSEARADGKHRLSSHTLAACIDFIYYLLPLDVESECSTQGPIKYSHTLMGEK